MVSEFWLSLLATFVCLVVGRGDDNEGAMVDRFFPIFGCVFETANEQTRHGRGQNQFIGFELVQKTD
jgi:hypothetical protein